MQYIQEKIKIENYINEDLGNSESDSDSINDFISNSNNETESDFE